MKRIPQSHNKSVIVTVGDFRFVVSRSTPRRSVISDDDKDCIKAVLLNAFAPYGRAKRIVELEQELEELRRDGDPTGSKLRGEQLR